MVSFNKDKFAIDIYNKRILEKEGDYRALAKKLNLFPSALHRFENKQSLPSLHTYYIICKWLKKDLNYYFKK